MPVIHVNHLTLTEDLIMRSAAAKKPVADISALAPLPAAQPAGFDYASEAELFPTHNRKYRRAAFGYRRFSRAAEAIRFAMEQLPAEALAGAYLEVREQRFDRQGIQRLYESEAYPLPRKPRS